MTRHETQQAALQLLAAAASSQRPASQRVLYGVVGTLALVGQALQNTRPGPREKDMGAAERLDKPAHRCAHAETYLDAQDDRRCLLCCAVVERHGVAAAVRRMSAGRRLNAAYLREEFGLARDAANKALERLAQQGVLRRVAAGEYERTGVTAMLSAERAGTQPHGANKEGW